MPENKSFDPSRLCQIAVVVKSIDETVKFYQELFAIGPFEIREANFPNATYYGKKAGYRGKRAFAQLGPVTLELIELIEGKTVHEDFLKEKGEGLHHIGCYVDILDEAVAIMEKQGISVLQSGNRPGGGYAYMDTEKTLGAIFELIRRPTSMLTPVAVWPETEESI